MPQIESYRFGHIVIDQEHYSRDLIILPTGVQAGWWREEGHRLCPADLEAVLQARPDVVVVGQGANGRLRVTAAARKALAAVGIELIAQNTKKACETHNALSGDRAAAAALHLTC